MSIASILRPRLLVAFALALILSASAYGFAAANTVGASNAGDGVGTISGYTVSKPAYTLNSTDPSTLDSAAFTITPLASGVQPGTVKIQLSSGGTWYNADHGSGTAWTLDLTSGGTNSVSTPITVASITTFRVVATD